MKAVYRRSLIPLLAIAVALLAISMPVQASTKMDERIKSSARKSSVFKTRLQADNIKIRSINGVVTLTGTVSEASHKSLAAETMAGLPGVKRVDNRLEVRRPDQTFLLLYLMTQARRTATFHRSLP